jgi:4-hydroxybenzoate polyprenyltransferase
MNLGSSTSIDTVVFSSVWLAAAAGALVAAASGAMGIDTHPLAVGLAISGTLVVYNVDRLRDIDRDRRTSPVRSSFVVRNQAGLVGLTVVAAVASALLAVSAGPVAALTLAPVLLIGLLHRRLKRFAPAKAAYVTACWLCVVVGLPSVLAAGPTHIGWVAAILAASIGANAIASNLRDFEAGVDLYGEVVALRAARAIAGLGVGLCVLAPDPVGSLLAVPLFTLIALARFQSTERFGLFIVDGALLMGALVAVLLT